MRHRHPGKYIAHKPKGGLTTKIKPIHPITIKIAKRISAADRKLSWNQIKKKYPGINPLEDTDKDGKRNYEDCKPLDEKKHWTLGGKKATAEQMDKINKDNEMTGAEAVGYKETKDETKQAHTGNDIRAQANQGKMQDEEIKEDREKRANEDKEEKAKQEKALQLKLEADEKERRAKMQISAKLKAEREQKAEIERKAKAEREEKERSDRKAKAEEERKRQEEEKRISIDEKKARDADAREIYNAIKSNSLGTKNRDRVEGENNISRTDVVKFFKGLDNPSMVQAVNEMKPEIAYDIISNVYQDDIDKLSPQGKSLYQKIYTKYLSHNANLSSLRNVMAQEEANKKKRDKAGEPMRIIKSRMELGADGFYYPK